MPRPTFVWKIHLAGADSSETAVRKLDVCSVPK